MTNAYVQKARYRAAWKIVGFLLVVICASLCIHVRCGEAALGAETHMTSPHEGSYVRRIWQEMSSGKSFEEALGTMGISSLEPERIPGWFDEEVLPAAYLKEAFGNEDLSLIGFTVTADRDSACEEMKGSLERRGWLSCESGIAGTYTLMKEKGACRWMMLSCTAVGDATSVVLHIQRI